MQESLDERVVNIDHGPFFSNIARIGGGLIALLTLPIFGSGDLEAMVFTPPMLLIGLLSFFSRTGVDLDPYHDRIRPYAKYVFFKVGKWESTELFPYVSVSKTRVSRQVGQTTLVGITPRSKIVDYHQNVYLFDREMRRKKLIQVFPEDEATRAVEEAKRIAEILNKKAVKYKPPARKSRRR